MPKIVSVMRVRGVPIRVDYEGAYIELTFGSEGYRPTEVINVWDYEQDKARIPFTRQAVRAEVVEWMKDQDEEWPEWLEGYLTNR